jgi:hypothetical protein
MRYKAGLALVVGLLLGQISGMVTSDYAHINGFPHKTHVLELTHENTPESDYACMRFGTILLGNLSDIDLAAHRQANCIVLAIGSPQPDGSFNAVRYSPLWRGRLFEGDDPIRIPANRIKTMNYLGHFVQRDSGPSN